MLYLWESMQELLRYGSKKAAEHFLKSSNSNLTIAEDAKQFLLEQTWEGNVRQLKNIINKAATFCTSRELKIPDIQKVIRNYSDIMEATPLAYDNDQEKIENNDNVQNLMQNPKIQNLINKISQKIPTQ